jgi:hypothetical protein
VLRTRFYLTRSRVNSGVRRHTRILMMQSFDLSISEPAVQAALVDWLMSGSPASDALVQHLGFADFCSTSAGAHVSATRSVWGGNGESDIVSDWTSAEGQRLQLLIEVKLTANFMDRQGARYQERAASINRGAKDITACCVLVAPAAYLNAANPETAKFDHRVPLEFFIENACRNDPGVQLISEALQRIAGDKPLGAKGLYPALHLAIEAACERRQNRLSVRNKATEWITLKGNHWPVGVNLNYRIRSGIAEIRVLSSYKGPRDELASVDDTLLQPVQAGGELFLKHKHLHVSDIAKSGCADSADVEAIVIAMEDLQTWWFRNCSASSRGVV